MTLALVLVGFLSGRVRYDMVALGALLFLTAVEIVPRGSAFAGFGHPAVITVAAMLVISRGLENSGVVDVVARHLARLAGRPETLVGSHATVVAAASGFMNNVGALALVMPVAIHVSKRAGSTPAIVLMPIAFASLLGGMVTMIGTPPNIVISTARESGFQMFDFAPVGLAVAVSGILFLSLVGWRLIPRRGGGEDEAAFDIEAYLTEVFIGEESNVIGSTVQEFEAASGGNARVLSLVRRGRAIPAPSRSNVIAVGDVLVVEADADDLAALLTETGTELLATREADREANGSGDEGAAIEVPGATATDLSRAAHGSIGGGDDDPSAKGSVLDSEEVRLVEAVVRPGSILSGRSPGGLRLRERYQINVLGVAREGGRKYERVDRFVLRPGDVLLLQAPAESLAATLATLGALPLAERGLRFSAQPRVLVAIGIAGLALAATIAGIMPISLTATLAAVAMGAMGLVTLREAYESIDWPILLLLGAMLPVGAALETTGAAERVASAILLVSEGLPLILAVALMLVIAMMLSDIVNNVAAAVLLIPIALSVATGLEASPDAFLMAVAVGASSAFLTPIGHQSNVLVMGPGGYHFSDYWKVGLPLEVLIVLVAAPVITAVWG
ncbi:MAG: SLC13 family permease [Chloroflexi bacterium]|nr:SLC13 family permease [Chloroflexota bacterium]